jgi:hypothetical protein
MKRIYADFNSDAEDGRISLHTAGSVESIVRLGAPLVAGERVVLYDGEMQVEAVLEEMMVPELPGYSAERRVWMGKVDDSTWREQGLEPSDVASEFLEPVWEPLMETQRTG